MAEVEEIECVDETTTFSSVLDCIFVTDGDELTEAELNMTVRGVKTVYNDLQSEAVCDTLFRAITSVGVPEVVPVNDTTSVLRYEVTGYCRGCPEPVLFEDSINSDISGRALSAGQSSSSLVPSFVQDRELVTTCTCPVGAERRGPVQSDFVDGYNEWIELKTEEGEIENLRELLSLTEEGTFVTEPSADSNGAPASSFGGAFPLVLFYSFAAMKVLRKIL